MGTVPTGKMEKELRKLYLQWVMHLPKHEDDIEAYIEEFRQKSLELVSKMGGDAARAGVALDFPAPKELELDLVSGYIYDEMKLAAIRAGIMTGMGVADVARDMLRAGMDSSYKKLERLARSETVRAYWKNQWDEAEDLGLVLLWSAEGGPRTCEWCNEKDGMVVPSREIRDHPNGRCTLMPVLPSMVKYKGSVAPDGSIYFDKNWKKAYEKPDIPEPLNPDKGKPTDKDPQEEYDKLQKKYDKLKDEESLLKGDQETLEDLYYSTYNEKYMDKLIKVSEDLKKVQEEMDGVKEELDAAKDVVDGKAVKKAESSQDLKTAPKAPAKPKAQPKATESAAEDAESARTDVAAKPKPKAKSKTKDVSDIGNSKSVSKGSWDKAAVYENWRRDPDALELRKKCFNEVTNLTKKDQAALKTYTGDAYTTINQHLRGIKKDAKNAEPVIKDLDAAMKKSKVKHDVVTYRETDINQFGKVSNLKNLVGKEIKDDGYMSTSIFERVNGYSTDEPVVMKVLVPKGTQAAYVAPVSDYPDEYELLLNRGTRLKIVEAEKENGVWQVRAEVVGQ